MPETHYAKSGDVNIAYQVGGEGPFDLVFVPGFVSNVELGWQVPGAAAVFRRLASFCRLIRFDKRGTGMSDRVSGAPTLETRMDDVRAVMDAAGSARAALLGVSEGGPMSALFAATYPERCWSLVLYGTFARILWAPDHPWGPTEEEYLRESEQEERSWGSSDLEQIVRSFAPSADDETRRTLTVMLRQSASPGAVAALNRMNKEIDVRAVLPAVRVPTLVVHRAGDPTVAVDAARYMAERISGSRYVELPGVDHAMAAGDPEPILREIESFLSGAWEGGRVTAEPDRVLATVLFTDIIGSTAKTAELGDRDWRELLERHHELVRQQLARFRGREIDTAGDGFFASFDGPARAIHCAEAIAEQVQRLGIEIRAGLHTGECELVDGKVAGIAVSIGARVAAEAGPGEVLVSSTVKDLVAGSEIAFEERGAHVLKGIPGEWRLYAVA